MKVELTLEEQYFVKMFAELRYLFSRLRGTVDQKKGGQSNEDTDKEGLGAEMAFCKLTNKYPLSLRLTPDTGFDCIAKDKRTIDIKSTKHLNGHLIAKLETKNNPADIYVLMVGEFPTYWYKGCATKEELFQEENITELLPGKKCYALPQYKLSIGLKADQPSATEDEQESKQ